MLIHGANKWGQTVSNACKKKTPALANVRVIMKQEVCVGPQIAAKVQGQAPGSSKRNRIPETMINKCAQLGTLLWCKLCLCILFSCHFFGAVNLQKWLIEVWWGKGTSSDVPWEVKRVRCYLSENSMHSGHKGRKRVIFLATLTLLCSPIDLRLWISNQVCSKLW